MARSRGLLAKLAAALLVAGLATAAGPARAQVGVVSERSELVAGWDFSEFFLNFLSVNGIDAAGATVRPAQYTSLPIPDPPGDPVSSGVFISNQYGTLFFDGQFGSTAVSPNLDGFDPIEPRLFELQGSLTSNLLVGGPFGIGSFDELAVLELQGQAVREPKALSAIAPVKIVFRADVSSAGLPGSNWSMSFAGITTRGPDAFGDPADTPVEIEFDPLCDGGFTPVGTAILNGTEQVIDAALGPGPANVVCVRLGFAPTEDALPSIDNVAIFVPEPATGASAAALSGLGLLGWRRRRRSSRS